MKSKGLKPLKVSLHGMDKRLRKIMKYYLKLHCKGTAIVVDDDDEAHVEIVYVDLPQSKSLLNERLAHQPSKPIIAISINEISTSGVIYVKKPIHVTDVLVAFGVAKDVILGKISLKRTDKPVHTSSKASNAYRFNKIKTPRNTRLESNKVDSGFIMEVMQKFKAIKKLAGQQAYLPNALHIKQKIEKVSHFGKSESFEQHKSTKDEIATRPSSVFLQDLWHHKSLITGLVCLFMVIAGIYMFQSIPIYEDKAPIYEARAQILIRNNKPEIINVNSSSSEDLLVLDKEAAQKKINELTSRQLAGRVIDILQLSTIPEFMVAVSVNRQKQAPTSKLGQERQAAERLANMTDYFLQNLKVTQFKNTPIINIDYKAINPEIAARIVNQLAKEYHEMQRNKKIEMENKLAEQETKEPPITNQDTDKIAKQTRSATASAAPINFGNVNTNAISGNGGDATSNAGTTGSASGKSAVSADSSATRTLPSSDPFTNEKVITTTIGKSSDANVGTTTTFNTLSTDNIIQNVTNGSDFGTVISKATIQTLTTGNFTQNVASRNNFGGMVSNQVTNVGINAPKVGGVNITTQVGIISVNP